MATLCKRTAGFSCKIPCWIRSVCYVFPRSALLAADSCVSVQSGFAGAVVVRSSAAIADVLELTDENVEMVLDEIRPYLMAGQLLQPGWTL